MKKIVSLLCAAAMLVGSLALVGCQNGTSAGDGNARSAQTAGTGVVMGYVLDNRGEPVDGATVTLGGIVTTTNAGGEFVLSGVPVNVDTNKTATFQYSVTAKKDGYLSAVIPAIAVSYEESQSLETKDYFAALKELSGYYKGILEKYADKAGLTSTQTNVLNPNNDLDTGDFVITTTNEGSGKDNVMQTLANAIKDLEKLYSDGDYYTQFYSTFGKAVLIPCDATFKGKVRVTTKVKGSTVYSEDLFVPASKPVVRVSYTTTSAAVENGKNDYTWKAEVDDKGFFSFEKLPSGVELSVSIDSFYETKDDVEYVWSSASGEIIAENSGAEGNAGAINKVKLGSADSNENTYSFILYAQNDKIWITASNLGTNTEANLIKTTDPITFTFNKPILKATIESVGTGKALEEDIKTHGYTSELSEDKKTVTFKPVDGNWTGSGKIEVKAEAEDGATTVLNKEWTVTLDDKTWISLEGVNYGDNAGLLSLSSPIVLKFTRPMTENVTFSLSSTNEYTRTWSDDKTVLTLNPSANAKYWKVGYDTTAKAGKLTISGLKAEAVDGTKTVAFWKNGAKEDGSELTVYFDTFVDVTLAKTEATGHEAFTITFSKALKSIDVKDTADLKIQNADASKTLVLNKDYTVAIDADKKVITVTSKEAQFPYEGKYKITLNKDLEAFDGSAAFRKAGDKAALTATTNGFEFTTDFSFEGLTFKPVSIEVIDSLPATAVESRASIVVTTDKVLKFTFNKEVKESKIKITTNSVDATTKNYIDFADAKVVYVPLETVKNTTYDIVLTGTVDAKDDVVTNGNHSDQAVFDTANIAKWFNNTPDTYTVYAALNLTATSLIKGLDHVTGKPEYSVADPIAAGAPVTFTFDKKLDNEGDVYTASYKIFGKKDVNDANAKIELLVENGTAAVLGNTVTVTDATFKTKKVVGDVAEYYLELRVNNAKGVKVFSTTSPYFGSIANTLEAYAKANVYDAPASSDPDTTPNTNKNYGSFKIKVAEKNHLVKTNLIKETTYSLTKSAYAKADALPAKSAITFTFDSLPEGATASYELYDLNTAAAQVISSGAASIADKVVTVQTSLLVSGNPKVDGKTFAVVTNATDGISTYYLKLEVKDKNGNVLFSTANKLLQPVTPVANDKRTDFEKAVYNISATSNGATETDLFKVEVAPLAVKALSWSDEDKDAFGNSKLVNGKKSYKVANLINPKSEVKITFNANIPAKAKYTYKITDGSNTVEEIKTPIVLDNATDVISIKSTKFVAKTTANQKYFIELTVLDGDDKIFATDSTYFGNASDFEKAGVKYNDSQVVIDPANKAFVVEVWKTQIVTNKVDNVESKTTKVADFQKSFKKPITLQFSHPVKDYKVVLYNIAGGTPEKLYTSKTEPKTWATDVDLNDGSTSGKEATKYADFIVKAKEFIFPSDEGVIVADTNDKVITVTPTVYYGLGKTVALAIFNDEGKYVDVKDDAATPAAKTFATTSTAADMAKEIVSDASAQELKVETVETKVGDNQTVVFSLPTDLSSITDEVATYKLYVKNAEASTYTDVTNKAVGYDGTAAKLYGVSSYKATENQPGDIIVTRENYILNRAPTTYIGATLDATAFGIRKDGKVNVVLVKEQDGKFSAYKAELADKCGTAKVTVTNYHQTSGANATINADNVAVGEITITGNKSLDPANGGNAANETTETAFKFDLELGAGLSTVGTAGKRGEYIKDVSGTVSKKQTNTPGAGVTAKSSKATISATYDKGARLATVTVADGAFYIGDEITITVIDSNDNTSSFIFKIK